MGTKATVTKSGVRLGVVAGGRRAGAALKEAQGTPATQPVLVAEANTNTQTPNEIVAKDHFVERDGVKFAGTHLLIELWNCQNLGDMTITDQMLRDAATEAGATLLHIHLHHFGPNAGLSGVAVLAESHISIHTWPERGYAALDIFMCGSCDPYKAIPVLKRAFKPGVVQLSEQKRGVIA
jgi:S-adenosylmethionine decarboxylase